jgi:hypothetical protein
MNSSEEKILRENIQQMIRIVKQKRIQKDHLEEQKLRGIIKQLTDVEYIKLNEEKQLRHIIDQFLKVELMALTESGLPDDKPTPNKSTGINVLEDLLKKIIPVIEIDFRQLTTSAEQRKSYRAHIVNAVVTTLTPVEINTAAGDEEADDLEEALEVDIIEPDEEKFIDIRTDNEKAAEEEEKEADPKDEFSAGLEGQEETGRNMAFQSFNKVEGNIVDAYELLSDPEDQELFYDYLIANLKLYFDKFESELASTVEEPTNQAYDTAKEEEPAEGGEEELGLGGEEELGLGAEEGGEEEELAPLEEVITWDI